MESSIFKSSSPRNAVQSPPSLGTFERKKFNFSFRTWYCISRHRRYRSPPKLPTITNASSFGVFSVMEQRSKTPFVGLAATAFPPACAHRHCQTSTHPLCATTAGHQQARWVLFPRTTAADRCGLPGTNLPGLKSECMVWNVISMADRSNFATNFLSNWPSKILSCASISSTMSLIMSLHFCCVRQVHRNSVWLEKFFRAACSPVPVSISAKWGAAVG